MFFRLRIEILIIGALGLGILPARQLPGHDGLTPTERGQLEKEEKIDNRIRIYEAASLRYQKTIEGEIQKQEAQDIPDELQSWSDLLLASLKDIEGNVGRKKKSKNLIRFEIQLRKALLDLRNLKFQIPNEYQDEFESVLDRVDGVHKKLVDILFQS